MKLSTNKIHPVEVCVTEWLTPWTLDLEVQGPSLACRVVSLDKELYSTLSLFTQVYKWVLATYCWGITLRWTSIRLGGSSNTPSCFTLMKPRLAVAVWAFGSCAPLPLPYIQLEAHPNISPALACIEMNLIYHDVLKRYWKPVNVKYCFQHCCSLFESNFLFWLYALSNVSPGLISSAVHGTV